MFFIVFPHSFFCSPVLPFRSESVSRFPNFFWDLFGLRHFCRVSSACDSGNRGHSPSFSTAEIAERGGNVWPVAQRRIWCKGSCLWCPSARWCLKADRMGWMECAGNPRNCDVFHKKTSRTESIRSVAWNTPPRCLRPFVQPWNDRPLALSVPKAGCPCHGRRALQLSPWCLVASKGIMQDGTFACGFPYHADSHRQSWESGVSLWMV